MKKILLLAVVCCTLMVAQAQRVYFIYLQSDNKSAFYLKTGDKVYSSTASGYLIVPRLADSTYNVVIGKQGLPEARFTIPVNGKDHGFLLREGGQKLSLFNLQTMDVVEPATNNSGGVSYTQKTDRFTTLLSKAADDSTLLQMAVFAKVEKQAAPAAEVVKAAEPVKEEATAAVTTTEKETVTTQVNAAEMGVDTVTTVVTAKEEVAKEAEVAKPVAAKTETETPKNIATNTEALKEAVTNEPAAKEVAETVYKRSVVTRRGESSTSEGFGLWFTDEADGMIDTIRIVIPNPKMTFGAENGDAVVKEDTKFLDLEKETAEPKKEKRVARKQPAKEEKEVVKEDEAAPKKKRIPFLSRKENTKAETETATENEVVTAETENTKEKETVAAEREAPKKKKIPFLSRKENNEEAAAEREVVTAKTETVKKEAVCKNASESDFAKLRRSLAGKSSEDDMIAEAQKYFKGRCYTTAQLKTLSSLFLTSAGRYRFFDAAYNHVSDKEKFYTLQNELWDREDINRFKALLAK